MLGFLTALGLIFTVHEAGAANGQPKFDCGPYLFNGLTYQTLIKGIPDPMAAEAMDAYAYLHHVFSYSNPIAISNNGALYSGWHKLGETRVDVREVATGRLVHMFKSSPDFNIKGLSNDGQWALAVNMPRDGSKGHTNVRLVNTATNHVALDVHVLNANDLSYRWLERDVIQVGLDDGVHVYRLKTDAPAERMSSVMGSAPVPLGERMYYATTTNRLTTIRMSRLNAPELLTTAGQWKPMAWEAPQLLSDNQKLRRSDFEAISGSGSKALFDRTVQILNELGNPSYSLSNYRLSPSGKWLVLEGSQGFGDPKTGGNFESYVDVYDVPKARLHRRFYIPHRIISAMAFSPNETELAWIGVGLLEVVNISTEEKIASDLRESDELTAFVDSLAFVNKDQLIFKDGYARLRTVRFRQVPRP